MHDVVRGPVYEDGEGIGLFIAGLHHCGGEGSLIATISLSAGGLPETFTLEIWPAEDEVRMTFIDGTDAPWASEPYLGRLLSESEARESGLTPFVFEVADLVCETVPEVSRYLDM